MSSIARILVVEDDPTLRAALSEALEENGYEVACASDGRDALAQLGATPIPSVILLDLAMPVMDGWSFRAAQRKDPRLAAIPTVVVSATPAVDPHALDGLEPAAALTKPFDLDRLITTIQRLCASCPGPELPSRGDGVSAGGTMPLLQGDPGARGAGP